MKYFNMTKQFLFSTLTAYSFAFSLLLSITNQYYTDSFCMIEIAEDFEILEFEEEEKHEESFYKYSYFSLCTPSKINNKKNTGIFKNIQLVIYIPPELS
jgi:hypothetical protein